MTSEKTSQNTPLWLWPNLLSLDAPLVAVAWQWLLAVSMKIKVPGEMYVGLALTVWVIYVGDRLLDSFRLKDVEASTPRHRFYLKYRGLFCLLMVMALAVEVYLFLYHVPTGMYHGLGVVAFLVMGYYLVRFVLKGAPSSGSPREILCGMIFAIGSMMTVYFYAGDVMDAMFRSPHSIAVALLFCGNCAAIAFWEKSSDRANQDQGISAMSRRSDLMVLLGLLALAAGVMQFLSYPQYGWAVYTAVFLSALGLVVLRKNEDRLSKNALRVLADAVLLTPLLIAPILKLWMSAR